MAQRFGGKYSPDGNSQTEETRGAFEGARVDPVGLRANLMFLPPLLLGFLSLNEGAIGLATGLAGAAVLVLGAWLLREGLRAEAAFDARKVARKPTFPRKIAAALLCEMLLRNRRPAPASMNFGRCSSQPHLEDSSSVALRLDLAYSTLRRRRCHGRRHRLVHRRSTCL